MFRLLRKILSFGRKGKTEKTRRKRLMEKMVVGVVIGGAIGTVVGKRLLDQHREKKNGEDNDASDA